MFKKTFLLSIILLIILSFNVSAVDYCDLANHTMSYYELTNLLDSTGIYNLTNNGVTQSTIGKIGTGYDFVYADDDYLTTSAISEVTGQQVYFAMWFNSNTSLTSGLVAHRSLGHYKADVDNRFTLLYHKDGILKATIGNAGVYNNADWTTSLNANQWYYVAGMLNTTHIVLFVDNVERGREALTKNANFNGYLHIGSNLAGSTAHSWDGLIDEVSIINRSLDVDERTFLYDAGSPDSDQQYPYTCLGVANNIPSIVLITPVDDDHTNDNDPTFYANYTDAEDSDGNCTLYVNNTAHETETAVTSGTIPEFELDNPLSDGVFEWYVNCSDGTDNNQSDVYNLTIDTTNPTITWFNPLSNGSSVYYDNVESFLTNITISDTNLYAFNFSLRHTNSSVIQSAEIINLNSTSHSISENVTLSTLDYGTYIINVTTSDDHTELVIKDYDVLKEDSKLTYDTDKDIQIIVESEDVSSVETTKLVDRYDFTFDFVDELVKDRVFYLKSDAKIVYRANSPYKAHFVIYKGNTGNWVDFEGVEGTPIINKVNDYYYQITFKDVAEIIKFKSIGGLNIVSEEANFTYSNYCSEDVDQVLGSCVDSNQSVSYTDNNFATCCNITGLVSDCSILTTPYNETTYQVCDDGALTQSFNCSIASIDEFKPRMPFSCIMPDTQEYKCIVNVFENGTTWRILQTNPQKTSYNDGFFTKITEDREFFTSSGGILNAYFTDDNLLTAETFRIDTICTNGSVIYTSQNHVETFYNGLSGVANRTIWIKENASFIFVGFLLSVVALLFIGFAVRKVKGR